MLLLPTRHPLLGKVQPARVMSSQFAAAAPLSARQQQSIAEVAAAAAAQAAAAATGGDHAAVAPQGTDSAADGTDSNEQQLWAWYVAPYDGRKSVQEMETAKQIAWRQQQKNHNQRFRQLNLVLQRVHELAKQGHSVLPFHRAARVDAERLHLRMDLPKYVKHLERKQCQDARGCMSVGRTCAVACMSGGFVYWVVVLSDMLKVKHKCS
jgi:hypothetical protein